MNNDKSEERRIQHWHLEKSVSLSHLLTTIIILGSLLTWIMKSDNRMSIAENDISYLKIADSRLLIEYQQSQKDIKEGIIRIEQKIDGKQDKINKP